MKIEVDIEASKNETKFLPGVNPSYLLEDQRGRVEHLLLVECDVFLKNDSDIGTTGSLKLKLYVTDPKPVWRPYRTKLKQLYSKVKQYLEDLITNNCIKTSYSLFANLMVCVRKKDGSMRLGIDYKELNKKRMPGRKSIPRIQNDLENLGGHQ